MDGSSPRRRGTLVIIIAAKAIIRFIPAQAGNTSITAPVNLRPPVHPRAGGEHWDARVNYVHPAGSSPRRRGTPSASRALSMIGRFIPAQAGNTRDSTVIISLPPVHPRAGGEHTLPVNHFRAVIGSSPRRRGTRPVRRHVLRQLRFIPAQAGNTTLVDFVASHQAVHPRAGGEHDITNEINQIPIGSSPRRRGTPWSSEYRPPGRRFIPAQAGNTWAPRADRAASPVHPRAGGEHFGLLTASDGGFGSSPRRRGTPKNQMRDHMLSRFIPAQAGNTSRWLCRCPNAPVHPRAGGEHSSAKSTSVIGHGSSPRRRGTRQITGTTKHNTRFIPAQAGNTSDRPSECWHFAVHPRAGGEHEYSVYWHVYCYGSSPRRRGTLGNELRADLQTRFIPAQAGNTCRDLGRCVYPPVHPRAGGEHKLAANRYMGKHGSSPRRRGTPPSDGSDNPRVRFIPAQAGNTPCNRRDNPHDPVHPRAGGEHFLRQLPDTRHHGSSPRRRGTRLLR